MSKAFSLIELLVVITITALLVAIAMPSYQAYKNRANMAKFSSLASKYLEDWITATDSGKSIANVNASALTGTPLAGVTYNQLIIGGAAGNYVNLTLRDPSSAGGLPFAIGNMTVVYLATYANGTYSWQCNVYMPNDPLAYGGTYSREQTRQMFFPNCGCMVSATVLATCP